MKYIAVGFVSKEWNNHLIYLPEKSWQQEPIKSMLSLLKEISTPGEKGAVVYRPFKNSVESDEHFRRPVTDKDWDLLHRLESFVTSSYVLMTEGLEPPYDWVDDAEWPEAPPSCPTMIEKLKADESVVDFFIITEISPDEQRPFKLRCWFQPAHREVVQEFLIDLGFQVQLLDQYGFLETFSQELYSDFESKIGKNLNIKDQVTIMFDH